MKKRGFTVVELLVVVAIISILSAITFGQYRQSRLKANDVRRKADLNSLYKGLLMVYNDSGAFPVNTSIPWGAELTASDGTLYMKQVPLDSNADLPYYAQTNTTKNKVVIFSNLENPEDSEYNKYCPPCPDDSICRTSDYGYYANNGKTYHYAVFSSNTSFTDFGLNCGETEEPSTNTPVPASTNTPVPTATNTPISVATQTLIPTEIQMPTRTPTPTGIQAPTPTVTRTPTPTATPTLNKTCSVGVVTTGVGSISITLSGRGNGSGTENVRLFLERTDGLQLITAPTGTVFDGCWGGVCSYYVGYCTSTNSTTCNKTLSVTGIPAGNYYLHCDLPAEEPPIRCSGNPFCNHENPPMPGGTDCSGWISCSNADNRSFTAVAPTPTATRTPTLVPPTATRTPTPTATRTPTPMATPGSSLNAYYVSTSGNDSNPGTESQPWKTIAKVNSVNFQSGDTVYFKRGESWAINSYDGLEIKNSGTRTNPITFSAYGGGNNPIISNPGTYHRDITVRANWIVIENFKLIDAQESGVYLESGGNNTVRNCEITNVGVGVMIETSDNLITGNNIHDLKLVVNTPGGDDDYGANGVFISTPRNEISYNTFKNCKAPSYDYGDDGGAVELFGVTDGTYVHHNYVEGSSGFVEIGGSPSGSKSANNISVAYNLLINNERALHFNLPPYQYGVVPNNFNFNNNTVVESGGWQAVNQIQGTLSASNLNVRNNIFYGFRKLADTIGFSHSYNMYYGIQDAYKFTLNAGESYSDPRFVSTSDYHLQSGSPAIDKGTNLGYTTDFEGSSVPQGSAPDIGAYEW